MADNTVLDAGAGGDTIATDDIGGVKYQIVKVSFGALDTATAVTTGVGLPTDPLDRAARDLGKVDIAMGQGAHDAAGSGLDPVAIAGYASAAAPADVSADTDITRAWFLRNGAQATVVTAAGALIGGDAANGLDVDVTRVTGTVTISGTVTANAGTNLNTSALSLETTQASVLTSVQLIDDTIKVLGTDTYTEATTKGSVIAAVRRDADTTLVDTTNEIGPLQMDANGRLKVEAFSGETLPVSLTSTTITGSVAVTNAGTFVVQENGAALTALQLIDNPVQVLGTDVYTEATSSGMTIGAVRRDADTTLVNTTNEFGPLQMDANGRLKVEIFDGGDSHTVDGTITANIGTTGGLVLDATLTDRISAGANPGDGISNTQPVGFIKTLTAIFNGTGWDRLRATSNGLNSVGTGITAAALVGQFDDTTPTSITENQFGNVRMSANRNLFETIRDAAGNERGANVTAGNALVIDGSAVTQPISGNIGILPITTGGSSDFHLISAATTNATNIKASAGQVYGWSIFNTNAAVRYVKLHNTAGAPTAGTGVVYTIGVPATGGNNIALSSGIAFSTGIAVTTVTGTADTDTAAVAANDLVIDIHYK